MRIETTMYEEARKEFEEAGTMELGSEQHVKTISAANSMVDRMQKSAEIEIKERELDIKERELDIEEKKLKHGKRDTIIKHGLTALAFVTYLGLTVWGYKDSQRFESEGNMHTTEGGRNSQRSLFGLKDMFKKHF